MEPIYVALIAGAFTIIGSVISFIFGRQRARSESKNLDSSSSKIDSESESITALTIRTFQGIYQDLIQDQTVRISRLEKEQTESGSRIVGLEKLVEEQRTLITELRAEIAQLKNQLVSEGHVPGETEKESDPKK